MHYYVDEYLVHHIAVSMRSVSCSTAVSAYSGTRRTCLLGLLLDQWKVGSPYNISMPPILEIILPSSVIEAMGRRMVTRRSTQSMTSSEYSGGVIVVVVRYNVLLFSWLTTKLILTNLNNCLRFHPTHGTLATVGSDGRFSFWDKDARTKLKNSEGMEQSISCCAFNSNGQIFAYSVSYDWSKVSS